MNLERFRGSDARAQASRLQQVSRKGHLPRARRKSPRGDLRGLDQLPASRLFIQNFDLLIGQLADETIYHQPCLAEASCEGRMHPVKPFIMACR